MKQLMVRYKVKPEQVTANERLVRAVFSQLDQAKPDGLRYASFKLPDGQSFVHIASIDTADGKNPLVALEAFREFAREIEARCVEPPVTTALESIGAYPAD